MYSKEVLLCFSLDFYRSGRSSTQLCWDWSFRAEQSPSFQLNAADLAAAKVETSETTPLRRTTTSTYGPKHVALQWDRSRCGRHSRHSRHTYVRTLTHTTLLHKYTDHCALPRVESLGWKKIRIFWGEKWGFFHWKMCLLQREWWCPYLDLSHCRATCFEPYVLIVLHNWGLEFFKKVVCVFSDQIYWTMQSHTIVYNIVYARYY